jgi:membrane protease YdiL (CAAX protease family)
MARPKPRRAAKPSASSKAREPESAAPAARSTKPLEPWRPVHLILGVLTFVAAAILWLIAEPEPGDNAFYFVIGICVVGIPLTIAGVKRLTDPNPKPSHLDELHFGRFFLDTWKQMDEEARLERAARRAEGKGWDYRPLVALVGGAVMLTLMEYYGSNPTLVRIAIAMDEGAREPTLWTEIHECFSGRAPFYCEESSYARLLGFVWWSGWRVLGYLVVPALLVKLTGQRIRDQGLETKGFMEHAWIYAFAYSIVFVCVVIVSYTDEFSSYYPFYKLATRSGFDFVAWEILYAAQFFSLEFFFRGFWLKQLKPMMGSYAIFAMVVPYCMIHYGKPFAETMGAIVAGIVLGTLAMKTRSIWSGFLIHVSVAISMDAAALAQTTGLPAHW